MARNDVGMRAGNGRRAGWAMGVQLWSGICGVLLLSWLSLGCAGTFLTPDQAFHFEARLSGRHQLQLHWDVAQGYHLYRDRIKLSVTPSNVLLGHYTLPAGVELNDPVFGKTRVLEGKNTLTVPFTVQGTAPAFIELKSTYQGCANAGVCYPEQVKTIKLALTQQAVPPPAAMPVVPPPGTAVPAAAVSPVNDAGALAGALRDSFWLTLGLFFVSGLGLAFTPCIFPMIPILSALIVGKEAGRGPQRSRALGLSVAYVLGMSLTYSIAGVLAAVSGAYMQAAFQSPWVLGAFAFVFVLLALSMFDFYELQMPSGIQTRLAGMGRGGHLFSTFVMGVLSALIIGPCVAAPLAGGLLFISQTGDVFLGGLSLFALSLGMGVPLLIIGTSAGHFLPRVGAWMNAVKAVFGVVLLGVAIWLLTRVLPGPVSLALWAALAVISAIYLGALDAIPAGASGWRRFWKGLGVLMLVYGLVMGVGALGGGSDPLQPLTGYTAAVPPENRAEALHFTTVKTPEALQSALVQARGRPVLVDYWASWCVECLRMDKVTFADPQVVAALRKRLLIRVDVTQDDAASRALLKRYNLVGPPAFIAVAADGRTTAQQEGYLGPEAFMGWLHKS